MVTVLIAVGRPTVSLPLITVTKSLPSSERRECR